MSYQTPSAYSPMSFSSSSSSSPSSSDTSAGVSAPRTKRARVSAEHTLNRVRENQRRHRARQRDHVASLELKLAETERLLVEARAEIALLRQQAAERDAYDGGNMESGILEKDIISLTPPTSAPTQNQTALFLIPAQNESINNSNSNPTSQHNVYPDMSQITDLSFFTNTTTSPATTSITTDSTYFLSPLPLPLPLSLPNSTPPLDLQDTTPTAGPPPCCSDPPALLSPPPSSPSDPECTTCKTRPPPSPNESTTLCAQAYVLIRQQNFRNLDPQSIRLWLAQGLRRAQREGEGCRVENGALLRLLDFISGV
ncbi:hypothetical protein COCMIDRAFT_36870 [Bipolaris oryzae ATCC 44560]|uniref:BZIP domain-containing protein n=1 Tax=Bipolaris oryzae ATCC 44560 TaxID=930090 RepID=W6ZD81_COCMI|nr:uncharacterized protein COCMIDRAFT_36870 [Bipolaris oryzae ATCC 44560]EUC45394.1 hypothetical protein COCMIDRAFT_36870 [Bipolaris oryzae ATCC 44560]